MIRTVKSKSAMAMLSLVLAAGLSSSYLNADLAIQSGFDSLIAEREGLPHTKASLVAGSEDYWLRQPAGQDGTGTGQLERVVWNGPVAAGGTLVIGSGSSRKEFEVLSVEPSAESTATRIDMSNSAPAPMRVKARDGHDVTAPDLWLELTPPSASTASSAAASAVGHTL